MSSCQDALFNRDEDEEEFEPRRVKGGYFKPSADTIWTSPEDRDFSELTKENLYLLKGAWSTYCQLLTHPAGIDMLRNARSGWKRLMEKERKSK
jgi:hypothetical protein